MRKIDIASLKKNTINAYELGKDQDIFCNMHFINLCGHEIYAVIDDTMYFFPGNKEKIRIEYKVTLDHKCKWMKKVESDNINYLPKYVPGVKYIVSRDVLRAVTKWNKENKKGWKTRDDFVSPGSQIRDQINNKVIACLGFTSWFE